MKNLPLEADMLVITMISGVTKLMKDFIMRQNISSEVIQSIQEYADTNRDSEGKYEDIYYKYANEIINKFFSAMTYEEMFDDYDKHQIFDSAIMEVR